MSKKQEYTLLRDLECVEDYMNNVYYYLNEDYDLLEAINIINLAEEKILDGELFYKETLKEDESDYERFSENKIYKSLKADEELMFKCIDHYKDINKRDPDRSSDGIDNWFMKEDNLNSITICGRVTLKTNLISLVALFKELDLITKAINSFEKISILKEVYMAKWHSQAKIKMPLTIQNRDIIVTGTGVFDKKESMLMILLKSPTKEEFPEYFEEEKGYTRLSMNFGFYFCKYLDDNYTELFTCFNVNPNVPAVPWFILNNIVKDFGYHIMNDFRKASECEKNQEEYAKRIKANPELYEKVRKGIGMK